MDKKGDENYFSINILISFYNKVTIAYENVIRGSMNLLTKLFENLVHVFSETMLRIGVSP